MALGWDQALAVAAVTLGIPLIAAVPFAEQAAAWPEGSQLRYRNLLAEAAEVHTICPPGYAGWKMQQRNNWMVIKSDVLLALWNGTSGGLPSPFAATRYHSLAIRRATLPDCLEVTAESEDGEIMGVRHRNMEVQGVQFHPESFLTEHGHALLKNFLNREAS